MPEFVRKPYVPKKLGEINPKEDTNVRIFGTVLEKNEDLIVIDDGSQTKNIYISPNDAEKINIGDKVRIFCRVLPSMENYELQADLIQNLNDLDLKIYSLAKEKYGIKI